MSPNAYLNSVNLNRDTDFPYLVLDVVNDESVPRNPGFQVMHWHEDLQFIFVLSGEIEVVTLTERIALSRGEGAFLNKNVVHLVRRLGACHYQSFIFPDRFLKFYPGSPVERMVDGIVGRSELPVAAIRDTAENRPVLRALRALSGLEMQKSAAQETYPYETLVSLCSLWLAFCRTVSLPAARPQPRTLETRAADFLQYIALHYSEDISLSDIAAAANVSKSECLRCFKFALNTTPHQYLTEYRLSKAAELLRQTDEPIGTIAADVGFAHLSHFGKLFREKTGLSPREYRGKHR